MDIFIKLFDVLFPVFLTIGIGYWYGKKDPKFDTNFITKFAGNIGLPSIIFYSLTASDIDMNLFLKFSYYTVLYIAIFSVIGFIILSILRSTKILSEDIGLDIRSFARFLFVLSMIAIGLTVDLKEIAKVGPKVVITIILIIIFMITLGIISSNFI